MAIQLIQKNILLLFADFCEAEALLQELAFQKLSRNFYRVTYQQTQLDLCIFPMWGSQGVKQAFHQHPLTHYDLWINVGFAGACQKKISLMECFSIYQVAQLDINIPPQRSKAPLIDLLPIPALPLQTLVTTHKPYVYGFHKEFSLVDMEGYTIAQYAKKLGIPCMMMKLVSDYTEPKLRTNFHLIKRVLSKKIANHFLKLFPKIRKTL